jgi:hypothetical protein
LEEVKEEKVTISVLCMPKYQSTGAVAHLSAEIVVNPHMVAAGSLSLSPRSNHVSLTNNLIVTWAFYAPDPLDLCKHGSLQI